MRLITPLLPIFRPDKNQVSRSPSQFEASRSFNCGTMGVITGAADPIVTTLSQQDHVSWWRKKNLRTLYFLLFPACMGIELTSGFDSQLINALQIVPSWIDCTLLSGSTTKRLSLLMPSSRFPQPSRFPQGHYLGSILARCYFIASIHSLCEQ